VRTIIMLGVHGILVITLVGIVFLRVTRARRAPILNVLVSSQAVLGLAQTGVDVTPKYPEDFPLIIFVDGVGKLFLKAGRGKQEARASCSLTKYFANPVDDWWYIIK